MNRLATLISAFLLCAAQGAGAEVIRIGPNPCPVPADAEPYIPPPDVRAEDLSPWRDLASLPVIVDIDLDRERRRNRDLDSEVFQRFEVDPETGEILGFSRRPAECHGAAGEAPSAGPQ
ncbi:MAG: hypothetical protein RIC52_11230 [Amphiplicatus sp.]